MRKNAIRLPDNYDASLMNVMCFDLDTFIVKKEM